MPLTLTDEVQTRIEDMIAHTYKVKQATSGWGGIGRQIASTESETLLYVLSFAVKADELWLDGPDGLGGRIGGLYFGIVPHKQSTPEELLEVFAHFDNLVARDWGVHGSTALVQSASGLSRFLRGVD